MAEVDDTLHGETIAAESLAPENPTDFDDLLEVPREHYEIGDEIARGGMGRVVAARDRRTGRPIVIKEVRADLINTDAARDALIRRFKREAMLTARLQHPAVVPVYEIGRFGDVPFIAMKRVDGTPLLELLSEATSFAERMALLPSVISVAEAIAYAHSESVIHRDLKPANILVGSFGETIVIDWGLAKLLSEGDELIDSLPPVPGDVETVAGAVFGTPSYMPPEQAAGEEVDAAADVYALGALLYHLLAGEAPFSEVALDPGALIEAVRSRPPQPIADRAPDAPADLISVVEKAMARDAADRYTASELVGELRRFQSGRQVSVHDYTVRELLARWVGRHRALVITAAILVLVGAAATGWFVAATINARDRAEAEERHARELHIEAMKRTFDRGLGELEDGNRLEAIESIAETYPHLENPRVPRALAEALRGIRGFRGLIARFPVPIDAVGISADGARVFAISDGKTHLLTETGDRLAEIDALTARFVGDRLVTIAEPNRLGVWSLATGEKLGDHSLPDRYIGEIASGRDALFIRTNSGAVALGLDPLAELFTVPNDSMIEGLGVSADGQRFAIIKLITRVFDRSGKVLMKIPEPNPIAFGALAPDGSELIRAEVGEMVRYSATDGSVLGKLRLQSPHSFQYSSDASALFVINGMSRVCFYRLDRGQRGRCDFEDIQPKASFSSDLSTLAFGRHNGDVAIRDGDSGRVRQLFAAARTNRPVIALTDDGRRLVTGTEDGEVRLWDVEGDSFDAAIEYRDRLAVHADQLVLLVADHSLEVWNPDSPAKPVQILRVKDAQKRPAAVSGDNQIIAWAGATWDVATGQRIAEIPGWDTFRTARLDAAGQLLVGDTKGGKVVAHSAKTGERMWSLDAAELLGQSGRRVMYSIRIGPRGELMLQSAGGDLLLDIQTGAIRHRLRRDDRAYGLGAVFLATAVVAFDGGRIYVDDLETGERVKLLRGRGRGAAAHPDGFRVIVPLERNTMILDTRTGESRTLPFLGNRTPNSIALSPDGTVLAIVGFDGDVELFDLETLSWIGRRNTQPADVIGFSAGGRLLAMSDERMLIFDLPVETRPPAEVAAEVARAVGR